jgi:hypothetical protein
MATSVRRALLMLAALLTVMKPPGRPPGDRSRKTESTASAAPPMSDCVYRGCEGQGSLEGPAYRCDECGRVFYYCTGCGSTYPGDKKSKHRH